jgi:DNA-directed RNA polymerase subunit RPC12/RpoP
MDAPPQTPIATSLTCTQCGGELHPDEGQAFVTCPYCSSTVYVDKSRVVFHWYLAPTLDEAKARGALARWMAGNQTVKDLDKKSRVTGISFGYFPVWLFKRRTAAGKEEIYLEPAAATSVSELKTLKLPAGDLKNYTPSLDADALSPSVPLQAATSWLEGRGVPSGEIAEQALVHIPLFTVKYIFQNKTYTAIVEAGTGGVFANIFPAKSEAPYLVAGCATAAVFLCLATFPVIGAATGGEGALVGLLACSVLGVIAAPLLFMLAAWVAAKV